MGRPLVSNNTSIEIIVSLRSFDLAVFAEIIHVRDHLDYLHILQMNRD